MTTSKIKDITNVREWKGDKGSVYYFSLVMENGDTGSCGKKSETALKIGDELTYTLETGERGNKIKEIQQNGFSGGNRSFNGKSNRGSNASFALSYAKDVSLANIAAHGAPVDILTVAEKTILAAEKFKAWLDANE